MSTVISPAETGVDRIVTRCVAWQTSHAFCVPGADIAPLIDALDRDERLRAICATHEMSAGAMADGYSRRSGKPGLAIAIGGPGASYLVAAACAAARDGSPVLFVTGAAPGDTGPAALAGWPDDSACFTAAGAISVDASGAGGVDAALDAVARALASGRPAHLRFSVRDQTAPVDGIAARPRRPSGRHAPPRIDLSGRIALGVGAGALAHATAIGELSMVRQLPIVTDMLSRGVIPEDSPLALGHLGFMPHPRALAVTRHGHALAADRIIGLATDDTFERRLRAGGVPVLPVPPAAVAAWLQAARALETRSVEPRTAWTSALAELSRAAAASRTDAPLGHDVIVAEVAAALGPSAIHVIDAGHFHLIAPVRLVARQPRTILTASGLASMGWAIGAAIGAKCAAPDCPVVAYVGDGSFLMHGIELATAARHNIPVLFVVAVNGVYGTVRRRLGSRPGDIGVLGPASPVRIAEACGIDTTVVCDRGALQEAVKNAVHLPGPRVIAAYVPELDDAAQGLPTGLAWLDEGNR